jgi:EmrB/QacA subfamily drug resistance transporter
MSLASPHADGDRYAAQRHMGETRQHYGLTLATLTMAATAYALQQTMVVPALPELQRELGASTTWVTWVMTGFLLSAAVLTPILGKLGDRYGKERLLVLSLLAFLVGCIGCAAAPDIWTLIFFRVVSGAAGAVFPLSFGIIRDEFPRDRVKVGIGLLSAVFGIGGGLGLVLSGVIVDNASWRWLFVVGAIGVAIAIVLVRRFVPESPVRSTSRIDVPGAVLMSVVLVSFLLALSEGESWGWTSPAVLGLFALSAVCAVLWVVLELHVDEPLIDIRVLSERPVLLTNITALISGFAMFGSFVLVPRFVESPGGLPDQIAERLGYGFGATATMTGLYLLPGSLLMLGAGPSAGLLGTRFGSKWPLALGMGLIAVSTFGLAAAHADPWQIVLSMAGLSVGVGFAFAAMAALITEAVEPTETGIATGINTVMRTVGAVVGAQVGAAILTATTLPGTEVPTESAYVGAFLLSAVAAAFASVIAVFVTPTRRRRRAELAVETA